MVTTSDEFNEKYFEYLEKGYYGLDIDYLPVIQMLDIWFEKIISEYPRFKYYQIKLKFGLARFYADNMPSELIVQIEDEINEICKST